MRMLIKLAALRDLWDLYNAHYTGLSFSVSGQTIGPQGLSFNTDGTSIYVVGSDPDAVVYQYTLSTAWDVSTATYASKSFSVAAQETTPLGLSFNTDGTSMYVVGALNDTVYQYTLSTAWDVSTATYASKSFSVAAQETTPQGLFFKSDGTLMYVVGISSDTVYQYTLSTAWDVSTATYASKSFSVAAQELTPTGLFFRSNGTLMYVVGISSDTVYQYTLSTAWDVSTATYASKSFSVAAQETTPQGLFFKSDGTLMYVVGISSDTVYQYTLSTAWDVSTATYASKSFSVAAQELSPNGLFFRPNGTSMYVVGAATRKIYQYAP